MRRDGRGMLAAAAIVLLGVACAGNNDPYPLRSGPPPAGQRNPAEIGRPVHVVLLSLEVRPGDRLELLGAEAVGSFDGATVTLLLSRPVRKPTGEQVIGESLEPLPAAVVTPSTASAGPDNTVGIVGELTADRPGRFEVTNVRLRYRLNGGPEQTGQGIDVVWTVCAGEPAPDDCPE